MADHEADRFDVEQLGAVEEAADQPFGPLVELEIEIELGGADRDIHLRQIPAVGEFRHRRLRSRTGPGTADDGWRRASA